MLFLWALLGLAYAGNDESKCAMDVLEGNKESLEECKLSEEIDSLIADSQQCWTALGKCQGGGGGGGSIAPMGLIVRYGDKKFGFGLSAKHPLGACFDEIHKRALVQLEMDDDHELVFDWENANPKIGGKVTDDESLESALLAAQRMGFVLTLTAHKTTLAPTNEPTEPWGLSRSVLQVYGSVADGRDSGLPGTDANKQRKMAFNKISATTQLRLHYEDNFRVHNHGGVCYWELYLNGARCKGGNAGIIRGGMHSHGNTNNDHQTASVIGVTRAEAANLYPKGKHTLEVRLSGNGRDCYTGWDPESKGIFMLEVREVMPKRYGLLAWKTHYGDNSGSDNQFPIPQREVTFTKEFTPTILRFLWYDNFRVYNGGHCRWYMRVDSKICEGNKYIATSLHTHSNENDHVPQAFVGYCRAVSQGTHKLQGGVNSGGHDCYTGWESNLYMEVRELTLEDGQKTVPVGVKVHMFQRNGQNIDARDNGYLNWRVLSFMKFKDDSYIRALYSDNLRVHGHGKWCKWEIRMFGPANGNNYGTGKACTQNISGNRYVVSNQNDHSPGIILGYCNTDGKSMKKGKYQMKITVKGNSADCYTGWDRQSQNNFVLETEELDRGSVIGIWRSP